MSNSIIKTVANIITTTLLSLSTKYDRPVESLLNKEIFFELAKLFDTDQINNQGLQKAIEYFIENPDLQTVNSTKFFKIIEDLKILQLNDASALTGFVSIVVEKYPVQVAQYKEGKLALIGFLVGKCMEESNKTGNPAKFKELLTEALA
jgi:Asp-tRNA(Asn)/Glu-tRNA(Gln) amidotransferase B subunit